MGAELLLGVVKSSATSSYKERVILGPSSEELGLKSSVEENQGERRRETEREGDIERISVGSRSCIEGESGPTGPHIIKCS